MIFDSLDNRSSYEDIPGLKQILDALAEIHAGMDGHIAKPIDPEHLYTTLASYYKKEN
jgi:hypothetical protein